jgi:HAD superfamily hydrolase (TIGR01549 family)
MPIISNMHKHTRNGQPWGEHVTRRKNVGPAMLFDLDGTLIDAVYDHVLAWQEALARRGIIVSCWRIHRQIGLSGKSFLPILLREIRRERNAQELQELDELHGEIYLERLPNVRLLPGARELLEHLTKTGVRWAIGTSGDPNAVEPMLKQLRVPRSAPVILAKKVARGKPNPDVFVACAHKLGISLSECLIVGDSVWDLLAAQRARALGVGLLSGGYGHSELQHAGAYRVYQDPADLLNHLEELGIREKAA